MPTTLERGESGLLHVELQTRLALGGIRSVTPVAVLGENRTHVAVVIDVAPGYLSRKTQRETKRENGNCQA